MTIDALTAAGASHLSVDQDSNGTLAVAYRSLGTTRATYSTTSDTLTWTSPLTISSVNQGMGVTIRLNPVTGSPAIAYFDRANNAVYYGSCSGTATSCATAGWTTTQIETAAGVSGLINTNEQLLSASLVFGTDGKAYIFYPRGQGNDGRMVLAQGAPGSLTSSAVTTSANASLAGTAALNFAVSGWSVASARNSSGASTSVYLGPGSWLYASSCGD